MQFEITPEPTPEEHAAIEAAVAALLSAEPELRDPWWEAGVRDAVEPSEGPDETDV